MRAWRILVLCVVLGAGAVTADPAGSQQSEPVVRIQGVLGPGIGVNTCVTPTVVGRTPGRLELVRDGDLASELTAAFVTTGPIEPTSGAVVFPAGAAAAAVELTSTGESGGFFEVALVDGATYQLGDPSTFQGSIDFATTACPLPTTTASTLPRTGGTAGRPLAGGGVLAVLTGTVLLILARRRGESRGSPRMRH